MSHEETQQDAAVEEEQVKKAEEVDPKAVSDPPLPPKPLHRGKDKAPTPAV